MLKCKDVTDRADALLAGELTLRQRLALGLHLLVCVYCRRYLRQLKLLLAALPHLRARAGEREVEAVMAKLRAAGSQPPP